MITTDLVQSELFVTDILFQSIYLPGQLGYLLLLFLLEGLLKLDFLLAELCVCVGWMEVCLTTQIRWMSIIHIVCVCVGGGGGGGGTDSTLILHCT